MQWVKLHVTLRHNRAFRGLSVNAKVAFICGLMAAADYDQGGALCLRQRKLTDAELAEDLMLSPRSARLAILELVNMGFFVRHPDGVLSIDKWDEKCGEDSFLENHRERQKRYRERKRLESLRDAVDDVVSVTRDVTGGSQALRHNVTDKEEDIDIPTPSVDKSTSVVGNHRSKKSPDTSWVQPLREATKAIASKTISALTPDERQILARYHCLRFGNCTKTEASNKARASQVASAFASMSRSQNYGDMAVKDYVAYGDRVHANRDKTPWFDPWYIKSVVEWEQ